MRVNSNIKYLLFIVCSAIIMQSCLKRKEYPVVPALTYSSFGIYTNQAGNDSAAVITVNYTDGDSDIGLNQADTLAPFTGQFYYNCFVEYYELQQGVWVKPVLNPPFYYRIPPLYNGSQAIEGNINIELNAPFYSPSPYDTIKYTIQIADRALHLSNIVETPAIVVNK